MKESRECLYNRRLMLVAQLQAIDKRFESDRTQEKLYWKQWHKLTDWIEWVEMLIEDYIINGPKEKA